MVLRYWIFFAFDDASLLIAFSPSASSSLSWCRSGRGAAVGRKLTSTTMMLLRDGTEYRILMTSHVL
jgi:hypothetical protein